MPSNRLRETTLTTAALTARKSLIAIDSAKLSIQQPFSGNQRQGIKKEHILLCIISVLDNINVRPKAYRHTPWNLIDKESGAAASDIPSKALCDMDIFVRLVLYLNAVRDVHDCRSECSTEEIDSTGPALQNSS
jgi:hypothetical protein